MTTETTIRWQKEHPDRVAAASKRWKDKNKDRITAYNSEYYNENRDKYRELHRKWDAEHPGYNAKKCAEFYAKNRESLLEKQRAYRLKLRETVFDHYGRKCSGCGEDDFYSLEIHHKKGNGKKHRKRIGVKRAGVEFYRWLIKKRFPKDYETLCSECNKNYYHKDIII